MTMTHSATATANPPCPAFAKGGTAVEHRFLRHESRERPASAHDRHDKRVLLPPSKKGGRGGFASDLSFAAPATTPRQRSQRGRHS
ncbi:hypothetical protein LA76x_0091 [Lysobacter antibioticus]|uniref:Uncharacterized protein n=1 Tax=Lysobacter antibioticus TaxID=84531 RepID=A0A0S2F476_LYSAN|nr:hypothetical protein LA76x_0091 [Lysobacter antibioticus]